jgi:hypothetical protein
MMVTLTDAERKAYIKEMQSLRPAGKQITTPRTATTRGVNVQESVAAGAAADFSDTSEEARKKRIAAWKR